MCEEVVQYPDYSLCISTKFLVIMDDYNSAGISATSSVTYRAYIQLNINNYSHNNRESLKVFVS